MRRPLLPERVSALALAAVLLGSSTIHLFKPHIYEPLVPKWLGPARPWIIGSGVAEVACGALLLPRRTRRLGGWLSAGLFVFVFPGNIKSAIDGGLPVDGFLGSAAVAWARLPLQVPLVLWAVRHGRGPDAPPLTVKEVRDLPETILGQIRSRRRRASDR